MHMFHDALVSFAERRVIHMKKKILAGVLALSVIVAVAAGTSREEAVAPYLTDDAFDEWYDSFCEALNEALNK